jgi:hypothetical protein
MSQFKNIFLEIIKLIFTPSLMMTLCGYDLVYLMCSLVIFSFPLLWPSLPSFLFFPYSVTYLLPVAHIGMTGTTKKVFSFFSFAHFSSFTFSFLFYFFIFLNNQLTGNLGI